MLPKKNRLIKDIDFRKISRQSFKKRGRFLSLRFVPNHSGESRFGFVVANTISKKSTERNRLKRVMRSSISEKLIKIKTGFDVIIKVERKPAADKKELSNTISEEISYLLSATRLLQ